MKSKCIKALYRGAKYSFFGIAMLTFTMSSLYANGTLNERGNSNAVDAINVQDRTITGKVTSAEDGLPLASLSVYIKGTTSGVATETDGSYSITVPQSVCYYSCF
ncbi:carboxypeptidase-like regulatory domain-containing protein [Roseivirga echinicomitans]